MWHHKYLLRLDFRVVFVILMLMLVSLLIISSMTETLDESFLTPSVKNQIKAFIIGWGVFLFFAGFDYHRLKDLSLFLYILMVLMLLGLYFTSSIQSVHRWYRIPFIGLNVQPSEFAKLVVVITVGWFLERRGKDAQSLRSSILVVFIAGIPFLLILKQPDLGTALIFYPIVLTICYFGGVHKGVLKFFSYLALVAIFFVSLMFSGIISHERAKPYFTKFLKEYQYERLDPDRYHQRACKIAIAVGGIWGSGWKRSEFSSKRWLPAAHTDSVFASFGEEFGLVGLLILLLLFYSLLYFSFLTVRSSKDYFGRLLSSGIAVYLAMHIIVNIAMMCGYLPISGVPLPLVTYGGSSAVMTMAALGILQSIYTRRFMF